MATARPPKRSTTKRPATAAKPRKPAATQQSRAKTQRASATPARASLRQLSTTTAFSIGAMVVAAGAALTGYLARRQIAAWAEFPSDGHAAPRT